MANISEKELDDITNFIEWINITCGKMWAEIFYHKYIESLSDNDLGLIMQRHIPHDAEVNMYRKEIYESEAEEEHIEVKDTAYTITGSIFIKEI